MQLESKKHRESGLRANAQNFHDAEKRTTECLITGEWTNKIYRIF